MEDDFSIFHTGNFLPFHFHSIPKIFHFILFLNNYFHSVNKALRIISKTKIRGRIMPQYYKYEILKLEDLYKFEMAKLMYQFTHSKLSLNFNHYFAYSSDVSSYSTRHTSSNDIFLLQFMSSKTQHSINIGAKIWNKFSSIFHSILPYQRNFRQEAMQRIFCCFASLQCCKQPLVKVPQQ